MTTKPETYATGLGELIRAHRLYIGLSQRAMADRLGKDRRDYQRIETGRDACPPGLLSRIEDLSDEFAADVEVLLDAAEKHAAEHSTPLRLSFVLDPAADEWHRLVAGRAAVEAHIDTPIELVPELALDQKPA